MDAGVIAGIGLGCGAIFSILIVIICVIRSRALRNQRRFHHEFRGTFKGDMYPALTNLSRFSSPGKNNHAKEVRSNSEPRYVSVYDPPAISVTPGSKTLPANKETWQLPVSEVADNQFLKPPSFQEQVRGRESPLMVREHRPPIPLPRNLYSHVQPRGSRLQRSNSDCSSVVSYDLGDPRNSPTVNRQSSLYIPPKRHRPRAGTLDSVRSSGMGMDLGADMPKAWMMLENDYVGKTSLTRL